ncbi:hypothetical protein BSKO_06345 [Bryopsis sp. KO-2023]|nr:hypothetical protein BSKO_06345 [Bryopsis sp. KO-2023]
MASVLGVLVEGGENEHLCGTESCDHTALRHGSHTGWLVDGKLKCRSSQSEALIECCLDWEADVACQLVQLLDGHVHSDACGHEMVPHGDHVDYLVDGRLHHVVDKQSCCQRQCLGFVSGSTIVDHGEVSVLKQRKKKNDETERLLAEPVQEMDEEITTSIYAAGICCPSEVPIINKILEPLPGVKSVDVAVMTKTVKVVHMSAKVSPSVLVSALNDAGLQASLGLRGQMSNSGTKRPPWTVILSGLFLLVSIMSYFHEDVEEAKYVAIGAAVVGLPFILLRGWAALRRFVLDINVLMIIAVVGAIVIGEYHEAAAIVFLFGLAEWLEDRCMGKARAAVRFLSEMQPEFAVHAYTNKSIPVEQVQVGDLLIIRPGDRIPVDGVVVSGSSAVDESMLTGESKAVPKEADAKLRSGTVNTGYGSIKMKAEATVQASTIAQLSELVEQASMQKSHTEKFVESFAKFYTPAVVIAAALVAVIPIAADLGDPKHFIYLALVLLVTACPCALVISTPVVTVCGISRAAKQSILIKGGQYLEVLARIKAVTFDKTGTLTEGRYGVVSVEHIESSSEEEVLRVAAAIEVHSTHPLGPAIVGSAAARHITDWGDVTNMEVIAGKGIRGWIRNEKVAVGNEALMRQEAPSSQLIDVDLADGGSVCYVAHGERVIGAIVVSDSVRSEAAGAIKELRGMGVTAAMLTGDRTSTATCVATTLGMDLEHVHGDLLPEDKLTMVGDYKTRFKSIAHIGDGINDAPALAHADAGIAMGIAGSALAVEAADIALFSNDLTNLPVAISISKQVRAKLIQNVTFALVVKVVVIGLASVDYVTLWQAVLADVGSSMLVVLNGLTILGYRKDIIKHKNNGGCISKQKEQEMKGCCASDKCDQELETLSTNHKGGCCASKNVLASKGGCCDSSKKNTQVQKKGGCCDSKKENKGGCCDSKKNTQAQKKGGCCDSKKESKCSDSKHGLVSKGGCYDSKKESKGGCCASKNALASKGGSCGSSEKNTLVQKGECCDSKKESKGGCCDSKAKPVPPKGGCCSSKKDTQVQKGGCCDSKKESKGGCCGDSKKNTLANQGGCCDSKKEAHTPPKGCCGGNKMHSHNPDPAEKPNTKKCCGGGTPHEH